MRSLSTMKEKVELYITHRRKLGYVRTSIESGLLKFAKFVDDGKNHGRLTREIMYAWARSSPKQTDKVFASRLHYLHGFAKYYHAIDPKTEIPYLKMHGSFYRKSTPYIYTENEIRSLLNNTKYLQTESNTINSITMKCLLGLFASTGLRVSEALHLLRRDVDLENSLLTIRETKFHKSRYVPLHNTTANELRKYTILRDKKIKRQYADNFFITAKGRAICISKLEKDFRYIRERVGLIGKPRMADLRHTFACRRLLKWYQSGKDINKMIIYLSVYMGHVKVKDTYWYLTATSELMFIASKRFEQCSKMNRRNSHEY